MRQKLYKKAVGGILVLVLALSMFLPLIAGILSSVQSVSGTTNIESLMETGLSRSQAMVLSEALDEAGCGVLTGIQADDVGNGYELLLYDGREDVWYVARLDYYGNLLTLQEEGNQ